MSRQRVLGAVLALLTIVVIPLLVNVVSGRIVIPIELALILLVICTIIAVALTVSQTPNITPPLSPASSRSFRRTGIGKTPGHRTAWIGVITIFGFIVSPMLCLLGASYTRFGQYIIDAGFAILIFSILLTANASLSDGYIKQVIRGVGMLVLAVVVGILSVRLWGTPLGAQGVISTSNPDQGPLFLFSAMAIAIAGIIFIFNRDE